MHIIHVIVSIVQIEHTHYVNIGGGFTEGGERMRSCGSTHRLKQWSLGKLNTVWWSEFILIK